jgi:hypothetical protein
MALLNTNLTAKTLSFYKDLYFMNLSENQISKIIVESSLKVHRNLGPGLLESSYEKCLYHELAKTGLYIEKQ